MKIFLRAHAMKSVEIFFCFFLFISFLSPPAAAGTIFCVTENGAGDMGGSTWDNALDEAGFIDKLKDAAVVSGDQFWVAAGSYRPSVSGDKGESFVMKAGVALYGGFAGTEVTREDRDWKANVTILTGDLDEDGTLADNDDSYHVVTDGSDSGDSTVLDGFTFTSGNAIFSTNNNGAGMYIDNGNLTLVNCTFSGNTAGNYGGGLYVKSGYPTLTNCTFSGNTAKSYNGGGLYVESGNTILTNCTFSENTAENDAGGGLYIKDGNTTLTNCTFSENTAKEDGGGMYVNKGNPTLVNCTFSENTAKENRGGGLYVYSGNTTLKNCILWSSTDAETIANNPFELVPVVTYSVVKSAVVFTGEGNLNTDPFLGPLADNGGSTMTCALLPGSSAIDAGTGTGAPPTDQRGVSRPQGPGVDIGAFEAEVFLPPDAPVLSLPGNGATDISRTPTLQTESYSSPDTLDHTGTKWLIADENTFTPPLIADETTGPLTEWTVPTGRLEYANTYFWRVLFTDEKGGTSGWSDVWSFTTEDAPIILPDTPVLISPANGSTGLSLTPALKIAPYSHPSGTEQSKTSWQVSTLSTFASLTAEGQTAKSIQEWAVPGGKLTNDTRYYWRVQFEDTAGKTSEWSSVWSFTTEGTPAPVVYPAPDLLSPADGAAGLSLTPTLEVEFPLSPSIPEGSKWQIALESTFASPVAETVLDGAEAKWTIPEKKLRYGSTYYWRVQTLISGGSAPEWSDWSDTWSFTTEQVPGGGGSGVGCNAGAAASILLLLPLALLALKKRL